MRLKRSEQQASTAARLAIAALIACVVGSCSDPGGNSNGAVATTIPTTVAGTDSENSTAASTASEPTSGPSPHTSGVPRVEESECTATIPTSNRVKCLTLVVPETRGITAADPSRLVRLPVVIIGAQDPSTRLPDPVLWIDYDAGDGFVANRARNFTEESLAINKNRDVIPLDLRGSGMAEPSLA